MTFSFPTPAPTTRLVVSQPPPRLSRDLGRETMIAFIAFELRLRRVFGDFCTATWQVKKPKAPRRGCPMRREVAE
jgi:hypothetical protein